MTCQSASHAEMLSSQRTTLPRPVEAADSDAPPFREVQPEPDAKTGARSDSQLAATANQFAQLGPVPHGLALIAQTSLEQIMPSAVPVASTFAKLLFGSYPS